METEKEVEQPCRQEGEQDLEQGVTEEALRAELEVCGERLGKIAVAVLVLATAQDYPLLLTEWLTLAPRLFSVGQAMVELSQLRYSRTGPARSATPQPKRNSMVQLRLF